MYTLVRALALPKTLAAQWIEVSLNTLLVSDIYANYRRMVLTLLQEDGVEVFVDMAQLQAEYATYNNTLPVLLQTLGTRTLEILPKLPNKEVKYIKYVDVYREGFHVMLTKRGMVLPPDYPRSEKTDLELTRSKYPTDLTLIHTHCLASVNGFIHMTDTDGERAFVVDGGKSMAARNMNHVGLTSFGTIGALSKHILNIADVSVLTNETPSDRQVSFTIPESTEGKSFFLVLGGFLVMPEVGVFWQVGLNEYRLNLSRLPYLERLLESRHFIDLSPLQLTESDLNEENLNLDEVWSDNTIRRYFVLSQSFFVTVDTPNLFMSKRFLRQMKSPGIFTAYQEPTYPLLVATGRLAEYWKVREDGQWAVTVADSYYRNYIFSRQNENTLENVSGQLANDRPFFHSQGFLLEIGAYK